MSIKGTKKKSRKNSNYRTVVKYITIDQICRKALCDMRNFPPANPEIGQKEEVIQNKYEKSVNFCTVAQIITPQERDDVFEGRNHVAMSDEKIAEFTGIPIYQIRKNEFAFKAKEPEDFVRASMVRLALCDMINDVISRIDPDENVEISEELLEEAACYLNFCSANGVITEEQGLTIYVQVKQRQQMDFSLISDITGISTDILEKMAQA